MAATVCAGLTALYRAWHAVPAMAPVTAPDRASFRPTVTHGAEYYVRWVALRTVQGKGGRASECAADGAVADVILARPRAGSLQADGKHANDDAGAGSCAHNKERQGLLVLERAQGTPRAGNAR